MHGNVTFPHTVYYTETSSCLRVTHTCAPTLNISLSVCVCVCVSLSVSLPSLCLSSPFSRASPAVQGCALRTCLHVSHVFLAGRLAAPQGHVDVCGITLPVGQGGEGPSAGVPERKERLIRTPGVEASLRAAAVSLAQGLPLLLEGPPGRFYLMSYTGALVCLCVCVVFVSWGTSKAAMFGDRNGIEL